MKSNKEKLSGIFTPVVTPFQGDEMRLDDLAYNLKKLNKTDLTGYLALGSNGEFKSLSDSEQYKVMEVFAREKDDKVVMVGTGCESTLHTIEKSQKAAEMGFDYVSILTPNYFAKLMNSDALRAYYERIADALEIPVLLYNAPGFTGGVAISPALVRELSQHPNIVGIKDSSPVGPGPYLKVCDPDEDFHILAGSVNIFYPSLHLGAPGGIISLSNVLPEACCELYSLFMAGKYDEARTMHFRLATLSGTMSGVSGVAGVKAAMDMTGFKGGNPRHPLLPLSKERREQIKNSFASEGFAVL